LQAAVDCNLETKVTYKYKMKINTKNKAIKQYFHLKEIKPSIHVGTRNNFINLDSSVIS
jgi:hypothetical protein